MAIDKIKHIGNLTLKNEKIFLSGEIDFDNVCSLYQKGITYLVSLTEVSLDFSAVIYCNSAAIALMVEWIKFAKLKNKKIQFCHVPSAITSIIEVARIGDLLS